MKSPRKHTRHITLALTLTLIFFANIHIVYATPSLALTDGVWGIWSADKTFTVKPIAPTPKTPSGNISDRIPNYTWTKVAGANKYQIQLRQGTTLIYNKYPSYRICGTSTCSKTHTTVLGYGDYKWRIRAKVGGVWGNWSAYKTFTVKPLLVSTPKTPSGNITDRIPKYTWTKVAGATKYQIQLRQGTTFIYNKYPSSSTCGTSTCSKTHTTVLGYGDYKWRVRAKVDGVWGMWSAYKTFTVKPIAPTPTPTPNNPSGNISDKTPKYTWTKVAGATNYQIQLRQGTTFIYNKYPTSSTCGTSTCSKTPTTVLGYGDYEWRARAQVGGLWGMWSAYKTFSVKPILVSTPQTPSGDITDRTPKYTWTKVTGATNYQIQLSQGTTLIYNEYPTSSTCETSTCSKTPTTVLGYDDYKWRVRAKVEGVWGIWSAYKTFSVKPTLVLGPQTPSGDITERIPKYTWTKVAGANKYQIQLRQGTTLIYNKYPSYSICGTSTCSKTHTTVLGYGDYKWRVRAKVDGVWGMWSAYKTFSVKPVPVSTPQTPSGDISDRTPKYTWTKVTGATNYQIQLRQGTTLIYNEYPTSSTCETSTCSNTPTTVLGYDDYEWRARAQVGGLWGMWSSYKTFTVKSMSTSFGNWISTIACQNLDLVNTTDITLTFYAASDGSAVVSYTDSIPANGSKNYVTSDPALNLPTDFLGSAVVSSSRPVACNTNTKTGDGSSENPYRLASSSGLFDTDTAPTMFAPQVMKDFGGWNSYIVVQNTSNSDTTVSIAYRNQNGNPLATATETATIAAYSSRIFYQDANVELPSNFIGSAKVTVTQPSDALLAVIVNFYNLGDTSESSQFHSYNGFSAGASKLYAPRVVRQFYGYNSGITIQNIGTIDTAVTITFYVDGNTYIHHTKTIQANAALPLYIPDLSELDPVGSLSIDHRFGNAILEADEPGAVIVAIINEDNRGNADDNDGNPIPSERIGQGSSYNAISAGSESSTLFFQQVMSKVDGIFSGGFQISNVTDQAGTCDITFYGAPEANLIAFAIEANSSLSMYAPDIPNMPDGFNAGVTAVCTVNVIGIANVAAAPDTGKVGDSFSQNNGINR